ncbi:MAG TPA: primosomal protein N', partial [Candidatus Moranbacteria bacterium]|nr:primosomal protein N' [Candidatus Moranbacteria bacterium]
MTEKSPQRFLLDIVPLTRLPLGRDQSLWYEHDEALPAGTPVRIPIGRREVFGVVLSSREDIRRRGGIKLKKIIRVCRSGRFTAEQMALAAYLSDLTLTPLGTVWRQFYIPAVSERTPPKFPKKKLLLPPPLSAHLKPIFREITASFSRGKTFLLRDTPATARDGLFFHLTEKILSRPDGQVLVLLPEVLSAVLTAKRFARHFPAEQTALIHNKVSVGALSRLREEISAGKIRLIIGTRKSVFLPFAKLSLIVIDEEHEIGFKNWDAAPRFDARDAARFLSRAHSCPLLAVSAAPRLTRRVPSPLAPPPASVPLEIIDMRPPYEPSKKPKKRSRFEIISPALREALEEVLRENRQALLFVNRRGMSAFSVCTDCRALLACPNCDRALISVKEGHWECLHCDHKTSIFPRCPRCKGLFFRNIGYGTEKIQERLSKLFPQARLARVDGHSLRRVGAAEETAADFLSGKTDILIGTQMALKDWRAPELALVGILDADALLSIPDIYADCRIF